MTNSTRRVLRIAVADDAPGKPGWNLAVRHLLSRAGLPPLALVSEREPADLALLHSPSEHHAPSIIIPAVEPAAWCPQGLLDLIDAAPSAEELAAALFPGDPPAAPFDVATFDRMLRNRAEERLDSRDEHGRWPFHSSLLATKNRIARPIGDLVARALGLRIRRILGLSPALPAESPWGGKFWSLAVTFDIDSAGAYGPRRKLSYLRHVLEERGISHLVEATRHAFSGSADPHLPWERLAAGLRERKAHATFFTQIRRLDSRDDYTLQSEPELVRRLRLLADDGHEIGVHGSCSTSGNADVLRRQGEEFQRLLAIPPRLYRAHYLRTLAPTDWTHLADAGYAVDSSLGFSRREGFRLGTSFPFQPEAAGTGGLWEAPLHLMDVTLKYHRRFTPQQGRDAAVAVLEQVRSVGGMAVLLWHPQNFDPLVWAGWEEIFWELLDWAAGNGARVDALGALVDSYREQVDRTQDPVRRGVPES